MRIPAQTEALWLRAGALLEPEGLEEPHDLVSARHYTHPALGTRRLIRLIPDLYAEAEDLAMSDLGFVLAQVRPQVGASLYAREPLAQHLRTTPESEERALLFRLYLILGRVRRAVESRPGSLWGHLEPTFRRIAQKAPSYLPWFLEEVGRLAMRAGQIKLAVRAFHQARDAERGLETPPDMKRTTGVYLEFALEGALSVRDLEAFAHDLAHQCAPEEAYVMFRFLCVRRTLRGVPPWSRMIPELRRLARAAKLDVAREERGFLGQILQAGALVRAPVSFWIDCRAALVELVRRNPSLCDSLLHLMPGWGEPTSYHIGWLRLLEETGALDAVMIDPRSLPPAQEAPAWAAPWWNRLLHHVSGGWRAQRVPDLAYTLLARAADRLRDEGVPLSCVQHGRLDPDLVDWMLEHRIPILTPGSRATCNLIAWAQYQEPNSLRPRPLDHLVAHPAFEPVLMRSLGLAFGDPDFERAAKACSALSPLRRQWLLRRAALIQRAGMREALRLTAGLADRVTSSLWEEFPSARTALEKINVATIFLRNAQEFATIPISQRMAERWLREPEASVGVLLARQWPQASEEARATLEVQILKGHKLLKLINKVTA